MFSFNREYQWCYLLASQWKGKSTNLSCLVFLPLLFPLSFALSHQGSQGLGRASQHFVPCLSLSLSISLFFSLSISLSLSLSLSHLHTITHAYNYSLSLFLSNAHIKWNHGEGICALFVLCCCDSM